VVLLLGQLFDTIVTPDTKGKVTQLRQHLRDPLPQLPRHLWFSTTDKFNYDDIGPIVWVSATTGGYTAEATTFPIPCTPHAHIDSVIRSAVIGHKKDHFFFVSPATDTNTSKPSLTRYIEGNVARAKLLRPRMIDMDLEGEQHKSDVRQISMRTEADPSHLLVMNVPAVAQRDPDDVREHLRRALSVQSSLAALPAREIIPIGLLSTPGLNAYAIPCRQLSPQDRPPGFFLANAVDATGRTRTTYSCMVLEQRHFDTLASPERSIVAVIRGLTKQEGVDDVILRAFRWYLHQRRVFGTTSTIETIANRVGARECREPVIVVYAGPAHTKTTIGDIGRQLGLHPPSKSHAHIGINGIDLVAYRNLDDILARKIPSCPPSGHVYATVTNLHGDLTEDEAQQAVLAAYPPGKVTFWALCTTQAQLKRVVVGLAPSFEAHKDIDHGPWIRLQSDRSVHRFAEYGKSMPRHREVEWIRDSPPSPLTTSGRMTDFLRPQPAPWRNPDPARTPAAPPGGQTRRPHANR
jgi:hypothetical protein